MQFTEPAMRPPQEAASVLLRATQGCTWNKCNFCYVSRGYAFAAVKPEELDLEAASIRGFFPSKTPIYLTGSNPFALSADVLKEYIAVLRRHFPEFTRVSLQSRVDDIARKSDAELRELCGLGLSHLYIGVENGNEEVLALMNKGHTAKDTVAQLRRLDDAGITYTNFYVLGLGGKGKGKESGMATAEMFNQVHPRRITTTGMTLFANTPVAEMAKSGRFEEASEREKLEELREFLAGLKIDVFYDGVHYLNPAHYRFQTGNPEDKAHVLADIDDMLSTMSDAELEMMVNRGQMRSL